MGRSTDRKQKLLLQCHPLTVYLYSTIQLLSLMKDQINLSFLIISVIRQAPPIIIDGLHQVIFHANHGEEAVVITGGLAEILSPVIVMLNANNFLKAIKSSCKQISLRMVRKLFNPYVIFPYTGLG